jgi:fructokinase
VEILAIGNAIVDIIAQVDEAFIATHDLNRGTMTLIDAARAEALYAAFPPAIETSGGSAANTAAVAAALGARTGFIGKVADDQLGQVFAHDIRAVGVAFDTKPLAGGAPTARSLIAVTPDGQRTMNTFLGACVALTEQDVAADAVADAGIVYLEGYLFDPPAAQAAFRKAAAAARAAGRKVALTLSDPFCVDRHRAAFRDLLAQVDVLFANEAEALSLFQVAQLDQAVAALAGQVPVTAVTRSEKGSLVVAGDGRHVVAAQPARVVDTTGAGDAYAAGFLAGLARGLALPECGRWGSVCAAETIAQVGPRPRTDLKARLAA